MSSKGQPPRSGSGRSRKRSPSSRSRSRSSASGHKPVVVRSRTRSSTSRAPSRKRSTRFRRPEPTFESRLWWVGEGLVWIAAVVVGLTVTATLAWWRAHRDVSAYLTSDRDLVQSTVWSAPMHVRPGMPADPEAFEADLLAAGYERVEHLLDSEPAEGDGIGLFARADNTFEIWTALPEPLPGLGIDEGRVKIRIDGTTVADVSRPSVTLPPTVLGVIGEADMVREPVTLPELSRWVEPALLSMEDARFRLHGGVDPIGILRAIFANSTRTGQQGGSTLTQQLAKNLFLSRERTLRRKIREVFFAAALESQLTKDELLELYLSEIYLGQMAGLPLHGVAQAAKAWFGKRPGSLELHEAALIVGVIPAPNTFSPVRHPEEALERRNLVLDRMYEVGEIDVEQLRKARDRELDLSAGLAPSLIRRAPYAVDAAVERVEAELGEGTVARGLQIHTTIHPLWQRAAEVAVRRGMAELDADYPKAADAQVALAAVRVGDGQIVAMVGGRSYADSAYNRATDANRQVGSTVKPLTVVKALYDQKVTPATQLADEPVTLDFGGETWAPKNYDGKFEGQVSLRRAIEASRNIPAVHLARSVGMVRLGRFFQAAGLSQATSLPSAALGSFAASPVELAGAYTVFERGVAQTPEVVVQVLSQDGERLWAPEAVPQPLVDDRAAAQAMDLLKGVVTSGTGARARALGVDGHAGGKTGTTDDYRDAWFVGLTRELSVAVWVGRDRGTLGLSGSRAALPTWAHFIASSGTQDTPFVIPEGLERVQVCSGSGGRAREACPELMNELFVVGTAPEHKCDEHGAAPGIRRFFDKLFRRRDRDRDDADTPGVIGADRPKTRRERRRNRDR